jgi:DNA-binding MarR family transcriptional regulator
MNPPPAVPPEVLKASFGQVLMRTARLFNELAIARVQARSEPRLRFAHTMLFPHLDTKGVRATTLAKKLGITKQAVGPLLDDLVEWGMCERVVDPSDKRAWIVRLTPRGGAAILDGLRVLGEVATEIEGDLGAERMRELQASLTLVMEGLERRLG